MTIRTATADDADELTRVHIATWRSAYTGIMPDDFLAALDARAWSAQRRARLAAPGPYTTLVSTVDSGITGFTAFGPYRMDGPENLDLSVGEILAIYVHPDHQGAGLGRTLMDAAVARMAAAGVAEIRLWVLEENWPSRRFYERYGLVADGQRDSFRVHRPGGEPVDLDEVRYTLTVRAAPGPLPDRQPDEQRQADPDVRVAD
jgi:ribosomal protein S18 acetylase RimI-like enzyme